MWSAEVQRPLSVSSYSERAVLDLGKNQLTLFVLIIDIHINIFSYLHRRMFLSDVYFSVIYRFPYLRLPFVHIGSEFVPFISLTFNSDVAVICV